MEEEPHYQALEGVRVLENVATIGKPGVAIDVQVVDQQSDLERVRLDKICKYAVDPDTNRKITCTPWGELTSSTSRLFPSGESADDLLRLVADNRRDAGPHKWTNLPQYIPNENCSSENQGFSLSKLPAYTMIIRDNLLD